MIPELNNLPETTIVWGASDQARVDRPIIESFDCRVVALVDDTPDMVSPFPDVPIFHGWEDIRPWLRHQGRSRIGFVVAIGNPYGHVRRRLHKQLSDENLIPLSFADKTAVISDGVSIGPGAQIMPGAVVHVDARIGEQCIVNTGAIVEHDCRLSDGVEIGPRAVLCGRVEVGQDSWICAGATVLPTVRIGASVIVGAGAVVNRDVPSGTVVVGVPARFLREYREEEYSPP